MNRAALLLVLSACVPEVALEVAVTGDDTPLAGALVACVCDPSGDAAALSGGEGVARLVVFNSEPDTCVLTIAAGGFETAQLELELPAAISVELEGLP